MANKSRIEWTSSTWNPATGCTKTSAGCEHCYAERMALRLQGMGISKYRKGFDVAVHCEALAIPAQLKKPQIIFVNSMGDLFHQNVPSSFIKQVFQVMTECKHHVFQVLTKRSPRLRKIQGDLMWSDNIWMGVTVENAHYKHRIDDLRATQAYIKFLSIEPLLGPLENLDLHGIDWVVVGGESGPGARPIQEEWVLDIKDQCRKAGTAFFFKQWGGVNKQKTGRLLQGKIYDEMPSCPQFESGQVSLF